MEVSQIAFPCRVDLRYPLYAKISSTLLYIRTRLGIRVGAQDKSADQLTTVSREQAVFEVGSKLVFVRSIHDWYGFNRLSKKTLNPGVFCRIIQRIFGKDNPGC